MKTEDKEKTSRLLDAFNATDRTIAEIWDMLGHVCPLEVRTYDQGEDVSVLVTQMSKGEPYGFPLKKGVRDRGGWYGEQDTRSVRIPEGGERKWKLVDMPFDDLEKALFRLDLGGVFSDEPPTAAEMSIDPDIDRAVVIDFGKHKGRTVGEVLDSDPDYIRWAAENIARFHDRIYRLSA